MSYAVLILRRAQRELARLPFEARVVSSRACEASELSLDREGRRIGVGDYRVIYEINDEPRTVTILHVGHRRDVYR